jgi:hypothetical protein
MIARINYKAIYRMLNIASHYRRASFDAFFDWDSFLELGLTASIAIVAYGIC